jgi:hypothetical protein
MTISPKIIFKSIVRGMLRRLSHCRKRGASADRVEVAPSVRRSAAFKDLQLRRHSQKGGVASPSKRLPTAWPSPA